MLSGRIFLTNNRCTTWEDVRFRILETMAVEDIDELRAFGSCCGDKRHIQHNAKPYFFGLLRTHEWKEEILPRDVDILVITKNKPAFSHFRPKVKAEWSRMEHSCGYAFSVPSSGYRDDFVHVTMVSRAYWEQALKAGDPDVVRINQTSVKF